MRDSIVKIFVVIISLFIVGMMSLITSVDRTPYRQTDFYYEMDERLDSLQAHLTIPMDTNQLEVGWSQINITPSMTLPLAGYGARDPKEMHKVLDSAFVRAVVFKQGERKVCMIFADLLIIHPEIRDRIFRSLPIGWKQSEIYFTATHTHSGQGAWAPGIVGNFVAGSYQEEQSRRIAAAIVQSIAEATHLLQPGAVDFGELAMDELVRNRLVKERGVVDPWLKVARIQSDTLIGHLVVFSAHATCYGADNHSLTADYPGELVRLLHEPFDFGAFAAGAVGSMAVESTFSLPEKKAEEVAARLNQQVQMLSLIGLDQNPVDGVHSFRLPLPLRKPYVKLTQNLALRPYLFESAYGDYANDISVAKVGKAIFIGLPFDFSGELAVPLYKKARSLGYQLFITSFNGGYAGYVVKDEWYDLEKYEARAMSWYGPDTGSYLSEIASRLIDILTNENNETHHARR